MPLQISARPSGTLVCGSQGSGKSTFVLRYLVNAENMVCRAIFDPRGEYSGRLRIPAAASVLGLENSLASGWVIFDPGSLFPGNPAGALAFFCEWLFEASKRGGGRKALFIDEVWKFTSPTSIPLPLAVCVQDGRKTGLEMVFATQQPNKLPDSILNEVTEAVCFRLQGAKALDKMEKDKEFNREELKNLRPGSFVARNMETGGELRGRVF